MQALRGQLRSRLASESLRLAPRKINNQSFTLSSRAITLWTINHGSTAIASAHGGGRRSLHQATFETTHNDLVQDESHARKVADDTRKAMRLVSQPVLLVTVSQPSPSPATAESAPAKEPPLEHAGQYQGMTISTFTTVSLKPYPVISFNIKVPSRALQAIEERGGFVVHFLRDNSQAAEIASMFSKNSADGAFAFVRDRISKEGASKSILTCMEKAPHAPIITDPSIVAATMVCSLFNDGAHLVPVNDHVILLARVLAVDFVGDDKASNLAYADGVYRRVGDSL